jgi:uncharacterized protein
MQFNVSSLLKEHTGATREYDIDDDLMVEGERRHVRGHARLDRTPRGILVRSHVSGTAHGECSRCLKPITFPVDIQLEEQYIPTVDPDTGVHIEPEEGEEDAYRIDARHTLDLSEAIAQYWTLAQPMAPLCDDACAGLCPVCGEKISGADHPCTREQVDARWEKLGQLKL